MSANCVNGEFVRNINNQKDCHADESNGVNDNLNPQQKNEQVPDQNQQVYEDRSSSQEEEISPEDKNGHDIVGSDSKPEDALTIFNLIVPNCTCFVKILPGLNEEIFSAVYIIDNKIQASGLGRTANEAKLMASENGIINFITDMIRQGEERIILGDHCCFDAPSFEKIRLLGKIYRYADDKCFSERSALTVEMSEPESAITDGKQKVNGLLEEYIKTFKPTSILCWNQIKTFAFSYVMKNGIAKVRAMNFNEASSGEPEKNDQQKKILPPKAADIHPPVLLDIMFPGTRAVEISRDGNIFEMGYKINDVTYTGLGSSKKEAKKKAAMKALEVLHNIKYSAES